MNTIPFVHFINSPLNFYFFDVNTNQFVRIPENHYSDLQKQLQGNISNEQTSSYIETLKKNGLLSCNRPQIIEHSASDFIQYHLENNIEQITLQLTQQCNFRCAYCTYAPKDIEYQRQHSSKKMSIETALKAIDFFFDHSMNNNRICIGFYGGEPFLELSLIKEIVKYSEKIFEGKDLWFSVTTNGSLFTDDVIKFISKHNFSVLVSLDGTPDIHNRSRKFASTGKKTFDIIEKNLLHFKDISPEVYEKIGFNIVIDPRFPCKDLHEMFTKNPLYSSNRISFTLINDEMSMEHVTMSDQYIYESNVESFKCYMSDFKRYPENKVSRIARNALDITLNKLKKDITPYKFLPKVLSHSGPCIPGQRRLFIDTDGNFFPCERVSETSSINKIGNLDQGFDFDNARSLLNIAQLTSEECKNCWAILHCTQCVKGCDNNGELSRELKLHACPNIKASIESNFKDYLLYKEFGYEFD